MGANTYNYIFEHWGGWPHKSKRSFVMSHYDTNVTPDCGVDIMTALGDGFFSIWMEVFCDEPEIRLALIEAFPGTNLNYYDEKGCVKEII